MTGNIRKYLTYDDRVIPTHFPRLLVEVAVEQGADGKELIKRTGIVSEMFKNPDARISLRQYGQLVRNALRLTQNPGLGIDLGRRIQPSNLGMVGLAAMSSPDAMTAIELALQYSRLLMPAWDLSLQMKGDVASLIVREAIPLRALHVFGTELLLLSAGSVARAVLGRELPLIEVRLDYPKPVYVERYFEFIRAPIFFEQPATRVTVAAAILKEKLPASDPITARVAERQCAASLLPTASSDGLIANVRRILGASPGQYTDPERLARILQTSERSMRRALKDMGTSYQALLDEARCEHAIELLTGTGMSINEIAERLGFSDGRSFRRAFKRWTGRTATQYRTEKKL